MATQQQQSKRVRPHGAPAKPRTAPDKKAAHRAAAREADYVTMMSRLPTEREAAGYHKPGSMNRHNQH